MTEIPNEIELNGVDLKPEICEWLNEFSPGWRHELRHEDMPAFFIRTSDNEEVKNIYTLRPRLVRSVLMFQKPSHLVAYQLRWG